jgi:hypothetical protein
VAAALMNRLMNLAVQKLVAVLMLIHLFARIVVVLVAPALLNLVVMLLVELV